MKPNAVERLLGPHGLSENKSGELRILTNAVDAAASGIAITDKEGRIVFANRALLRIFGYQQSEELMGVEAGNLFASESIRRLADVAIVINTIEGSIEEFQACKKDGSIIDVEVACSNILDEEGRLIGRMASFIDVSKRKRVEKERERLVQRLQNALDRISTLQGMIPICAACKKIRDDQGYWHQVEQYVKDHMDGIEFSHGLCPTCVEKLYPELAEEISAAQSSG